MAAGETPRPCFEVADVFRLYGEAYRKETLLPLSHLKVMGRIERCRTEKLGGHMEKCGNCGFEKNAYNSCRNRHCPKCQVLTKERWLDNRKAELLPTGYFHLVFTIPHDLNPFILCNEKVALTALFHAVAETLQDFALNPDWRIKGELGIITVLHTWGQTLIDHFHLHCLVPAGALSLDGKSWNPSRKKFLFRATSLAKAFRGRYISKLRGSYGKGELIFPGQTATLKEPLAFASLMRIVEKKEWIVYAKRPFAGPEQVLNYLGRYTHRIAISNERIKSIHDGRVTFSYKDRSNGNKREKMNLDSDEFIRRFLLHVLPDGFMKIRYFGFLANRKKKEKIERIRKLLGHISEAPERIKEGVVEMMLRITGKDISLCPNCKKGSLVTVAQIERPIFIWDSS